MMKQLFCLLLVLGLVPLEVPFQQTAYANPELIVQGKITQMDGSQPGPLTVQLMEISMSDQPSIKSVLSVMSDSTGHYKLRFTPETTNKERVFYRISLDFAGQKIGSDPFRPNKTNQPIVKNITLPLIEKGSQHLTTPKEVVIVESLEEKIRITNILFVVNSSTALIDAKKIPFEIPIPDSAINIQQLGTQEGLEFRAENGKILIGVAMPAGTKQVFFSYEIPVTGGGTFLDYPLIAGIQEIELTTPEKNTVLEIGVQTKTEYSIISQEKRMGGRTFYSKIIRLEPGETILPISISGIPISQSRLILPALVLFVVLLIGLALYLIRNKKGQPAS